MPEFVNTLPHAVQVSSGAFVPAYEKGVLDPKDENDKALIDEGAFIPARAQKQEES